jgi:hypothetical protein
LSYPNRFFWYGDVALPDRNSKNKRYAPAVKGREMRNPSTGSDDKTVRLWNLSAKDPVHRSIRFATVYEFQKGDSVIWRR